MYRPEVTAPGQPAQQAKITNDKQAQAIKQADLVVLNANPLTDIKNTRQIDTVWVGGRGSRRRRDKVDASIAQ